MSLNVLQVCECLNIESNCFLFLFFVLFCFVLFCFWKFWKFYKCIQSSNVVCILIHWFGILFLSFLKGDICPDDDISKDEKHNLEKNAIIKLLKLLNESRIQNINDDSGNQDAVKSAFDCQKRENDNDASRHLRNMWNEYELRETEEAKAVKDLDLLDMIVQADEYEQMISQDCDMLQEFFDGTMPSRFHNKYVKRLAQEIHFQRHQRLNTKMKSDEKQTNSSIESSGDLKCNYKELSERDNEFAFRYAKSSNVPKHIVQKVIQAYVNERKHDNSF